MKPKKEPKTRAPPKTEPPLFLDMPFDEALKRYAQTKPEEVEPPKGKKHKKAKPLRSLEHVAEDQKDAAN